MLKQVQHDIFNDGCHPEPVEGCCQENELFSSSRFTMFFRIFSIDEKTLAKKSSQNRSSHPARPTRDFDARC